MGFLDNETLAILLITGQLLLLSIIVLCISYVSLIVMERKKVKLYLFEDSEGKELSLSNRQLDSAIKHLEDLQSRKDTPKAKRKGSCTIKERTALRVERGSMLFCHQLCNVVDELRKAVLRQEWNEAARLLMLLCQPGLTRHTAVIIRTCLILLFNHPKSSIQLLKEFLRECTGYILEEDIYKFIKVLFTMREESLPVLTVGTYIRDSSQYKVIDEVYYREL